MTSPISPQNITYVYHESESDSEPYSSSNTSSSTPFEEISPKLSKIPSLNNLRVDTNILQKRRSRAMTPKYQPFDLGIYENIEAILLCSEKARNTEWFLNQNDLDKNIMNSTYIDIRKV